VIAEADGPLYNFRLIPPNDAIKQLLLSFTKNPPTDMQVTVKEVGRKDGIKLYLDEGSWVCHLPEPNP